MTRVPRAKKYLAATATALVAALILAPTASLPAVAGDEPATNVVRNSNFGHGKTGWAKGKRAGSRLDFGRVGRGGSRAAVLTTSSTGAVALRNSGRNSAVDLQPGTTLVASAWVRTSQPGPARLVLRTFNGSRTSETSTRWFTLPDKKWHRVSTTLQAAQPATNAVMRVGHDALQPGRRIIVDNATIRVVGVAKLKGAGFDGLPSGRISPRSFIKSLGGTNTSSTAYDDTSIAPDSRGRGKVLRTTLVKGTIHSQPSGNNGVNLFIPLSRSFRQACITYDIRFDKSFAWSLGGKLPGLLGVAPGVYPSYPTGGQDPGDRGWSGRLMWLGPKAYSWARPDNMAVSYMYGPEQDGRYGDNLRWNKRFVAGRWHTVTQCHTMNDVGRANGRLLAWMNGRLAVRDLGYVYRTRSDVGISHLVWSIFRGGGTMDWAGSRTGHVDIDNVMVTSTG